ncbi:hypothetical protein RB200_04365 [Streptomyces sp. PmtG]
MDQVWKVYVLVFPLQSAWAAFTSAFLAVISEARPKEPDRRGLPRLRRPARARRRPGHRQRLRKGDRPHAPLPRRPTTAPAARP